MHTTTSLPRGKSEEEQKSKTYPPLKAPIGLRAGSGGAIPPAATAFSRAADEVNERAAGALVSARALWERIREAIVSYRIVGFVCSWVGSVRFGLVRVLQDWRLTDWV